jgi:hypothetical protein
MLKNLRETREENNIPKTNLMGSKLEKLALIRMNEMDLKLSIIPPTPR